MKEQYFFHYQYSNGAHSHPGECKEGPYSMAEALKRRLDMGQTQSNWIELELK